MNKMAKVLTTIALTGLVLGNLGCGPNKEEIEHIYKKDVESKIYNVETLMHLEDLIEEKKYEEAQSYLDTCLSDKFNNIESYQSTILNNSNPYISDSVRINLSNKLDLIQDKIWNR